MDRIKVLLYLLFDAQQVKRKNRIRDIKRRLLYSISDVSSHELAELQRLYIELETLEKIEVQIYQMLDI